MFSSVALPPSAASRQSPAFAVAILDWKCHARINRLSRNPSNDTKLPNRGHFNQNRRTYDVARLLGTTTSRAPFRNDRKANERGWEPDKINTPKKEGEPPRNGRAPRVYFGSCAVSRLAIDPLALLFRLIDPGEARRIVVDRHNPATVQVAPFAQVERQRRQVDHRRVPEQLDHP